MALEDLRRYDVLVVGGGFSGVGAAIKLRESGRTDFAVLEKASALGGTWRDNTYPGCGCDVPSALYSFSFAPKPDWSHVFARQPEIEAYLEDVAHERGVLDHVHFDTEVLNAAWDDAAQRWSLETTAGPYSARVLIAGAGPLHEPSIPALPGLEDFEGTTFHSSRWNHEHDLNGRRVAVIGTGSSAIQFVPEIQPAVEHLVLFQRTAPWVLPKPDRDIPAIEKALFRRVPLVQRAVRELLYRGQELIGIAQHHERVMRELQKPLRLHLRLAVRDAELRRRLTPRFTLGCKRMLLSNKWYPALQQPNVDVVSQGVTRITPTGVVGDDGVERPVDTIIFGTGFHVTDPPIADRVRGRDGRTLAETWGGSPRAYLGTTVAGFPNLFQLIGPNLGNGHSSAIVLIEAQLGYVLEALRTMDAEALATVEVRREVEVAYNAEVQRALGSSVFNAGGCRSYYLDANGSNSTIYPWTTIDLRRRTGRFDLREYVGRPRVGDEVPA